MSAFLAFFHAYWPIFLPVILIILSSLITALTKYPKAENVLHILFDVFSVLTHSDSPGTMKMLLVRSKRPDVVGSNLTSANKGGLGAAMFIPFVIFFVAPIVGGAAIVSCGGSTAASDIGRRIVVIGADIKAQCDSPTLLSDIVDILPTVLAILQGQASNWQAQLSSLLDLGLATVCAVRIAINDLKNAPPAIANHPALAKALLSPMPPDAATKGKQWLSSLGIAQ